MLLFFFFVVVLVVVDDAAAADDDDDEVDDDDLVTMIKLCLKNDTGVYKTFRYSQHYISKYFLETKGMDISLIKIILWE